MAAEHAINFYSGTMEFSLSDFVSNVNLNYHRLINCRVTKPSYMNIGFQKYYSPTYREHGDKSLFGVTKRPGLKQCFGYSNGGKQFYFTDVINHQGTRYAIGVTDDLKTKAIFKQCPGYYGSDCNKITVENACSEPRSMIGFFNQEECTYNKFAHIIGPVGKSIRGHNQLHIGHQKIGDSVIAIAYILNNSGKIQAVEGVSIGDWLYITDNQGSNAVSGQAMQITGISSEGYLTFGEKFWLGIANSIDSFTKGVDIISQGPVKVQAYKKMGPTLIVAGKDSLKILTHGECAGADWTQSEWVDMGQSIGTVTLSLANLNGSLVQMTKNTISFYREGSMLNTNNSSTIYNTLYYDKDRDTMTQVQDYLILMGPQSTGIVYRSSVNYASTIGGISYEYKELLNDMGYFNKESVLSFQEKFYFVTAGREGLGARFFRLYLNVGTNGTDPVFGFDLDDMSKHFVNTDFSNVSRHRGDKVYLSKNDYEIFVFMEDVNMEEGVPYNGTKILVYDDRYKFWHRWYTCHYKISGWGENVFYGSGLYSLEGDEDNGVPFKQQISFTFGDMSFHSMKNLAYVKLGVGSSSMIGENTVLSIQTDSGGICNVLYNNNLHKTKYISTLNKLYKSGMSDDKEGYGIRNLIDKNPIGKGIYAGNGIGMPETIPLKINDEMRRFCTYGVQYGFDGIDCDCNEINKPTIDENGELIPVGPKESFDRLPNTQNLNSDRYADVHYVSKYAMLKMDLGLQGHLFNFELTCYGKDSVEWLGYFIGYSFMDNTMEHLDNTIVFESTPKKTIMSGKDIKDYLE